MFWFVFRKNWAVSSDIGPGKMFSASVQRVTDFYLISLKITFPFIFGQVTLFSVLYLQEQPFPFFSYLNCAFKET